jgi:hypothetical protein
LAFQHSSFIFELPFKIDLLHIFPLIIFPLLHLAEHPLKHIHDQLAYGSYAKTAIAIGNGHWLGRLVFTIRLPQQQIVVDFSGGTFVAFFDDVDASKFSGQGLVRYWYFFGIVWDGDFADSAESVLANPKTFFPTRFE